MKLLVVVLKGGMAIKSPARTDNINKSFELVEEETKEEEYGTLWMYCPSKKDAEVKVRYSEVAGMFFTDTSAVAVPSPGMNVPLIRS